MSDLDTALAIALPVAAFACLIVAAYHRLEVRSLRSDKRDLLDTLGVVRAENTRLKRERAIIRPPTQAEFAALSRPYCGTCSGSGFDLNRRQPCSCTNAKVNARLESGDMTLRDGVPWVVERIVA